MSHRSTWTPAWMLAVGLTLGCGPTIVLEEDTEADSGGESSDDGPPGATAPVTTSPPPPPPSDTTGELPPMDESTSGGETGNSGSFITDDGPSPPHVECSIWEQNCPEGEKCTMWAADGGNSWNATRCVPIVEDPGAPGDPCWMEGTPTSGIDTCDLGGMCWDVDLETLEGVCISFCTGDEASPMCEDPATSCHVNSGPLALCLPNCDPIAQDCPEGQACYFIGQTFSCVPDASGEMGFPGDPCEYVNVCDPGSFCTQAKLVPDCMGGSGCCTPYCVVGDPMPPCLDGQDCVPFFEEGDAPPGYELVGACVLQ